MNYKLNTTDSTKQGNTVAIAFRRLAPLMADEKKKFFLACAAIIVNSSANLYAPVLIAQTIDRYIQSGDYHGVFVNSVTLLTIYIVGLVASYVQTITMGTVGRNVLYSLRNSIFTKLQELPVAFFNQNKAGDVISRINNDTDKLNQFFSQALIQFLANLFMIVGAGIFLLSLHLRLGLAALAPALGVLIVTQLLSGWVKRKNLGSLQALGDMSAEIQESINNFKVIIAFNRLDYFRKKFQEANESNFSASVGAGIANTIFIPIYGLAANLAQLIVLLFGIYLIAQGNLTIGLLVGFLLYVTNFYMPLRQLAAIWASLQAALAGIDRISEVLAMNSDMAILPEGQKESDALLEFKDVAFAYPDGAQVLQHISLQLQSGKTYALVGPTGGGKTTTASLMARLYDPTEGKVLLQGKDIRSYSMAEKADIIGFILQEPFLFTGTVRENILYGNEKYKDFSNEKLREVLEKDNLSSLLARFEEGLDTKVTTSGDSISLGQKQLIAFMRAVLRHPDILILDEATANIDTVTEQLLEEILKKLPKETTKVIIAHRLNTIENADEIFFVGGGEVIPAGSMQHAVDMLMHGKK